MSRVEFAPIEPQTARSAASLNAFYTAFEAAGSVGPENLAIEGIDHAALDNRAHLLLPQPTVDTRVDAVKSQLTQSAAWIQTDALWRATGATIGDLAADEYLELAAFLEFETDTGAAGTGWEGIQTGATISMRWVYNLNGGGGDVLIPASVRTKTVGGSVLAHHGWIRPYGILQGPITFGTGWVEVQHTATPVIAAPGLQIYYGARQHAIRKFRRVS